MRTRIVISPEIPGSGELGRLSFDRFLDGEGEVVARSRSSETHALELQGMRLHVKRYRYSARQAFRGLLRNTFLGPSRVAREYRMLERIRDQFATRVAPRPVAMGEARRWGFLRAAFLATETIEDARPITGTVDPDRVGRFLSDLHEEGLTHGRLYARNLLRTGDGSLRIVDLDRAVLGEGPATEARAARDLACLLASLPELDRTALFTGYGRAGIEAAMEAAMPAARAGFARRTGPPHV